MPERLGEICPYFHAEPVAGLDSSDIHFVWRKQQASPLIQGFIDSIGAD